MAILFAALFVACDQLAYTYTEVKLHVVKNLPGSFGMDRDGLNALLAQSILAYNATVLEYLAENPTGAANFPRLACIASP